MAITSDGQYEIFKQEVARLENKVADLGAAKAVPRRELEITDAELEALTLFVRDLRHEIEIYELRKFREQRRIRP
jgi:hypothetical protein